MEFVTDQSMAKERRTEGQGTPSEEIKVSMFVDVLVLKKLQQIAELKGSLPKEEIHQALVDYIRRFEEKDLKNSNDEKKEV